MRVVGVIPEFIGRSEKGEPVSPRNGVPFPEKFGFYWGFKLGKYIRKYHEDVEYICVRPGNSTREEEECIDGVSVVALPWPRIALPAYSAATSSFSLALAERVARLASQERGSIVHVHEYHTLNSLSTAFFSRHPVVFQNHGVPPPTERLVSGLGSAVADGIAKAPYYAVTSLLERRVLPKGDYFFVLTEAERNYLISLGVSPAIIRSQTMGVDFDQIRAATAAPKGELRSSLGLEADDLLAVYVGNIDREKGAHWLPFLGRKMRASGVHLSIIAYGMVTSPTLGRELEREGVIVRGRRPWTEVVRAMGQADVFVLPAPSSYAWGGVGIAPLEAMACGLPVVSPTLQHFPRGLADRVGVQSPWVDDVAAFSRFSDSVLFVLRNHERFTGASGTLEAEFSWKSVADRTMAVYRQIRRD